MKSRLLFFFILALTFFSFGQSETYYPEKKVWRVAVFPLLYADIPANLVDSFPGKNELERIIFHEQVQDLYKFISNDEFVVVGDVYETTINPNTFWDNTNGQLISNQQILDGVDFIAPGYDPNNYDLVLFFSGHDATMSSASNVSGYNFTINGINYTKQALINYYQIGFSDRDPLNYYENSLISKNQYLIPLGGTATDEQDVWYPLSATETTLCHEIGHSLSVQAHANSSTNGPSPVDSLEIPNNGTFLNEEYGNDYCLMGSQQYSASMNGAFRNYSGILSQDEIVTVDEYGTQQITLFPINGISNARCAEVLLPGEPFDQFGTFKNNGYWLEVRTAELYDTTLSHPQLNGNTEGVFVHKLNGLLNLLLDMSPSPNLQYTWGDLADKRDVVLKPGMTYENTKVKFSNVVANPNGSFTLDVQIKNQKNLTPAPTIDAVYLNGSNQLQIEWTNNHLTSGNNSNIEIEWRPSNDILWQNTGSVLTNVTDFTTPFSVAGLDGVEVRLKVLESISNHESYYSNIGVYGCNLRIKDIIESPITCFGADDGKIEVKTTGGIAPLSYSIDNITFQASDVLLNLSSNIYDIYVKDVNGCSASANSIKIWEPKIIQVEDSLDNNVLSLYPIGGTGQYEYNLNSGGWGSENVFNNVTGNYQYLVRDRNGCQYDNQNPVSINDLSSDNSTFIYPNPTDRYLYLEEGNIENVLVHSINGTKEKVEFSKNRIDLKGLAPGVYIISIKVSEGQFQKRVVIQ